MIRVGPDTGIPAYGLYRRSGQDLCQAVFVPGDEVFQGPAATLAGIHRRRGDHSPGRRRSPGPDQQFRGHLQTSRRPSDRRSPNWPYSRPGDHAGRRTGASDRGRGRPPRTHDRCRPGPRPACSPSSHPDLAALEISAAATGWDNAMFQELGETISVRLPRRATVAAVLLENEQRWLPTLAAGLPLAVPGAGADGGAGLRLSLALERTALAGRRSGGPGAAHGRPGAGARRLPARPAYPGAAGRAVQPQSQRDLADPIR